MKEDQNSEASFTTMFDLYALPPNFPCFDQAKRHNDPYRRVTDLEEAFYHDINEVVNCTRFVPYIQLHEFESLVLAGPQQLDGKFLDHDRPIRKLVAMAATFTSPELIDDGNQTAPSKRIIREIPEYEGMKVSAGPMVAGKIGLPTLRSKCRHFNEWLNRLESLGTNVPQRESA